MLSRKALLSLLAGAVASLALPPFGIFPAIWCLAYPAVQFARAEQRSTALWIIAAIGFGLVHRVNPLDRAFTAGW